MFSQNKLNKKVMSRKYLNKKQQNGMTAAGWLIIMAIVLFFMYLGIKLVPAYMEFFSIKNSIESVAEETSRRIFQKWKPDCWDHTVDYVVNSQKWFDLGMKECPAPNNKCPSDWPTSTTVKGNCPTNGRKGEINGQENQLLNKLIRFLFIKY